MNLLWLNSRFEPDTRIKPFSWAFAEPKGIKKRLKKQIIIIGTRSFCLILYDILDAELEVAYYDFYKNMQTEFINLSLSRSQAVECLGALMIKSILEDELRSERGQETAEASPTMLRLATLLNIKEKALESQMDLAEETLWEYSWFVFTNEWAWFRAQQEAEKIEGRIRADEADPETRAEKIYKRRFNEFVKELDMHSQPLKNLEQRKGADRR